MTRREHVVAVGEIVFFAVLGGTAGYSAHGWLGVPVYVVTSIALLLALLFVVTNIERWMEGGS